VGSIRNRTDADLSVAPLDGRNVAPDELVQVPDSLLRQYVWPEETWIVEYDVEDDDPRTVAELREGLKATGQPVSGTKAELIERLAAPSTGE
jgi:SAP domain